MELRLYSFVNFYLSSIQQGIQTGHLSDNMSVKYLINVTWELPRKAVYVDWITNHKTYITLNGGANEDIQNTYLQLEDVGEALELPYGYFLEDEKSLAGIMTCCGIVVPENLFNVIEQKRLKFVYPDRLHYTQNFGADSYLYVTPDAIVEYKIDTPEWRLINLLKSCGLAR